MEQGIFIFFIAQGSRDIVGYMVISDSTWGSGVVKLKREAYNPF